MRKLSFLKNIALMCIVCGGIIQYASAQLAVTANVHLVTNGASTQIVLHNVGLVNNGIINHSSGNIKFNGSAITTVSGNGTLSLYNLELNKTANPVTLSRNISVKNQLKFTSGNLNLNGFDVDLLSSGTLVNETENSRITGGIGGTVKTTVTLNAPNGANPGNLGAVFTSTENFGSVSIQRGHRMQINDQGTGNSILRFYEINPTNNSNLKATLRFNYFNAELNNITESDLVLFKGSALGSWIEKGYTTRDATLNYVEKINNPDFSRWTLSNAGNVLASGCPGGVPTQNFYADLDGDGYGNPNSSVSACTQPEGYTTNKTDCNDNDISVHPGASEICNGQDDDCDGSIDENGQNVYYPDADRDGFGNNDLAVFACTAPANYITTGGDCNDNNAAINPGTTEICGNSIDDNCNDQTDEGCPVTIPTISINDIVVNESQGTAQLTIILSAASANSVSVSYRSINGTASHPKDYIRKTGDIVFAAGITSQVVTITIVADSKAEPDEYFDVQLHTPVGATINDNNGRVIITESLLTRIQSKKLNGNLKDEIKDRFDVKVSSNPTQTQFRLDIQSTKEELVTIQINDVQGKIIQRLQARHPFQPIYVGATYRSGVYFAHVMQGTNIKTVKLIKF